MLSAVVIGMVTSIVSELYMHKAQFDKEAHELNSWMEHMEVQPKELKDRVRRYHLNLWRRHKLLGTSSSDHNAMFGMLNTSLQLDIKVAVYRDLLKRVPLLKDAEDGAIFHIVDMLSSRYYLKNDLIIVAGTEGDGMYLVDLGLAGVMSNKPVGASPKSPENASLSYHEDRFESPSSFQSPSSFAPVNRSSTPDSPTVLSPTSKLDLTDSVAVIVRVYGPGEVRMPCDTELD